MIYDQNHKFYKYRLSEFVKISSIESKFDTLETFYKELIDLKSLNARTTENMKHKSTVLNNVSELYDDLIKEYKAVYEREPKYDKYDSWKQKYDFKDLRNLEYQPVKLKTESLSDINKSDLKQPMKLN